MSETRKISILDCTLRDGGYINQFDFGKKKITKIIERLSDARIEIVECGFLESGANDPDKSLFTSVEGIIPHLNKDNSATMYVAMIAYGDISIDEICDYDGKSIEGIRLTFHEKEREEALQFARELMNKGYKVFIQPVGTVTYTDSALLDLIGKINVMKPYAFYLVDTLGSVYKNDLVRMLYLIDNNLDPSIKIGFHSHNNLQLSFANAQELISLNMKRDIIIDASVFGMGRGAGNLCTELLVRYINENIEDKYDIIPILEIMDEFIMPIFQQYKWGYSAPYCLAAMNGCHPNYASYLIDRQTLCIRDINKIIGMIAPNKRHLFDKEYITDLYINFQNHYVEDEDVIAGIADLCGKRNVLVIAPGKTVETHIEDINNYISENNPVVFSVNFIPDMIAPDRVFIGNSKKFKSIENIDKEYQEKLIFTSNIATNKNGSIVNYSRYMKGMDILLDNSGMLLLDILKEAGVRKVALAGFDGYVGNSVRYCDDTTKSISTDESKVERNATIVEYLKKYSDDVELLFVTPSLYEKRLGNEQV